MKVAYITMQFPVASEAFAAVEIRALCRLGAEVRVLAYRGAIKGAELMLAERDLADLDVEHGGPAAAVRGLLEMLRRPADGLWLVGTILTHCHRKPVRLLHALALVPASFALLRRLEARPPDVVHLFWGHYPSLLGLLVRRRLPGTLVSLFLGAYDLERRFPLSALLARQAQLVLTHASANLPALVEFGVPAAAARTSYRGVEVPDPLAADDKIPGLVVVAERLVPRKCSDDALRVFARLRKVLPQAQLQICGSGPELTRLERLAGELGVADVVRFSGHLPHRQMLELLCRAEVVLTMSRSPSERLPNVIKEAMLRRCLCLATRTAGIEELIDDGDDGILVEFGDIEAAVRRLTAILADDQALARLRARAQAKVTRNFAVDRLMAERLQQWSGILQERPAGDAA